MTSAEGQQHSKHMSTISMTTTTTTSTASAYLPAAAAAAAALSAATTKNGAENSSPAFFTKQVMAPIKPIKRAPLCSSFKVESRAIFPGKEAPYKVPKAPIIPDREDTT
jgi:hypothetical protein